MILYYAAAGSITLRGGGVSFRMDRMDRKPVSFKLKSKGVKRPFASRDNLPPIEAPVKRHLVAKFVNLMKGGTIQSASTAEVKDLVRTAAVRKIRSLGSPLRSPLSQVIVESPSRSLMLEIDASQNDLSHLGQTVESLWQMVESTQRQIASLQADSQRQMASLQVEIEALKRRAQVQESFNFYALEFSLRAFIDKLLEAFYIAGGVGGANFSERVAWLQSPDAVKFCQEPGARMVELFDLKLKPSLATLDMMKKLRDVSSTVSRGNAHASTPIHVAYALEALGDLKGHGMIRKLFKRCFKMEFKDMIQQDVTRQLSPEFRKKFTLLR